MIRFKTFLEEGVNDPGIFKAVFLAGGPGSGKSFVAGKTALQSLGFKLINSDDAFERALAKAGLKSDPETIFSPQGQAVRAQAKALTGKKMGLALDGRLGLVIDGTGKDYDKIKKQVDNLREIGYSVKMLFVNTDLETALERNRKRARTLPDATVEKMWNEVQKNVGKFQSLFRNRLIVVDNSISNEGDIDKILLSTFRKVATWAKTPPENPIAKNWIKQQKQELGIREDVDARLKDRQDYETKNLEDKIEREKEALKRKHDNEIERVEREKESRDENFVNESIFPEFLKTPEFVNKTYDLNGRIPQEITKLKVIENGYSKIAKMLSWSLNSGNGKLTTRYINSQLNIHSDSITIDARTTFRGSSNDGFSLEDVDVSFRFKLTFNSKGVVNGIEKTSISGSVKGHRNHDVSGLTLAQIKKLANESAKRFL